MPRILSLDLDDWTEGQLVLWLISRRLPPVFISFYIYLIRARNLSFIVQGCSKVSNKTRLKGMQITFLSSDKTSV